MSSTVSQQPSEKGFGPIFSRIYSFFSGRSKSSARVFRQIAEEIASLKNGTILDVGCGPGVLISTLAPGLSSSIIFGVDPSPSMVKLAQKRLRQYVEAGKVFIEVGSSILVPFESNFDLIVSSFSYHHWTDQRGGLKYLAARLNAGGTIMIVENLRKDKESKKKSGGFHSLSENEAKTMEIDGLARTIKIVKDSIFVAFSKD